MKKTAKLSKKLTWKKIRITRVKLNPQQAVLYCCMHGATEPPCTNTGDTYDENCTS